MQNNNNNKHLEIQKQKEIDKWLYLDGIIKLRTTEQHTRI